MRFFRALSRIFHRTRVESELDSELHAYVDLLTAEKVGQGVSPEAARRAALIETGGIEVVKDQVRDAGMLDWLHSLWQDARYAGRGLRKNPGFTSIALLSLALGIGANSAIFGVFYAVLVRPLPYHDPGRLVSVGLGSPAKARAFVLTPEFVAWRLDQHVFSAITSWNDQSFNLTGAATPERLTGASVSDDFLAVLGIRPQMGRDFQPDDHEGAIITYELWQRQFAANPAAVGSAIVLNNTPNTLLGVLPPKFRFPGDLHAEILVPEVLSQQPDFGAQQMGMLRGIGRLLPGVTIERAAADLAGVSRRYESQMPRSLMGMRKGTRVVAHGLHTELAGDTRPVLVALLGAVGLLLLLACVNVANLQLARAGARRKEIALRAALGAGRARLARLIVIENLVLASLAGAVGLLVAASLLRMLSVSAGLALGDANDLDIGWRLAAAAFVFSTLAGLVVGLIPALLAPRLDVNEALKSGAVSMIGGRSEWVRSTLVVSQVALALVLLLGSGLLLRSLQSVLSVDLGFRPDHLLTASMRLTRPAYDTDQRVREFVQSLLDRVRALPGVESAAIVNSPPLGGYSIGAHISFEGRPPASPGDEFGAPIIIATPDYLHALGIRLLRGRPLTNADGPGTPDVAVVSAAFVKEAFHGADPIGKRIGWLGNWSTIVGVMADVRHSGREREANPEVWVSNWQHPASLATVLLRTRNDPMSLASSLRPVVWSIDKNMPISGVAAMDDRLARAGNSRRIQTVLLTSFGFLALLLSAVGIYGMGAEVVSRRTREIGLRMALGARAPEVVRMVMRRSVLLAASGIALGAGAGYFLVRYLRTLLFGVKATDTITFAAAVLVLFAVALLAGYGPARRAARIDPVAALRSE
jgi:putative ABC transport system permease protein